MIFSKETTKNSCVCMMQLRWSEQQEWLNNIYEKSVLFLAIKRKYYTCFATFYGPSTLKREQFRYYASVTIG